MENTLATEMIKELKANRKCWFIIALVELVIILVIVAAFLWYISLPVDEIWIENDGGNANYIGRDLEGDLYNGSDSSETESDTES